jgi:hypothetical protein
MAEDERGPFVRSVAGVVLDSLHPVSLVTGLVLLSPFAVGALASSKGSGRVLPMLCTLASIPVTMLVQSRLATNAMAGDTRGGLFSSEGGGSAELAPAFGRLALLAAAWWAPLLLVVWSRYGELQAIPSLRFSPGLLPSPLLVIYLGSFLIAPFFLLAAAVAASGPSELFSPGFWGGLFSGRLGEVFLMVAASAGTVAALGVILAPWLAALALKVPELARFLASLAAIYAGGAAVSIHSRLCGVFAASVLNVAAEEVLPESPAASTQSPAADAVRAAVAQFATDREGALAKLDALAEAPVQDARVFHALATLRRQAGDGAGALAAAKLAIPLLLRANDAKAAAELYRSHAAEARELWLDHEQLATIGEALHASGLLPEAANAWAASLGADAGDRKAFKGLLKIADQLLQSGESLDRAIRVYDFLVQRAPTSPFADHARAQLGVARRKAAKA